MSTFQGSGPNPPPPQTIYVQAAPAASPGVFWRLLSVVQWLIIAFVVVVVVAAIFNSGAIVAEQENRVEERFYSLNREATQKIAVITVDGTITDSDAVRKACETAGADEHVKAIVLRVDSPGGTVTASDQMYHFLRKLITDREIPLVVSMGGTAASGGYYISMACGDQENVIFAEPTTWTGSIGVMIPHYNFSGLMEKLAVEDDTLKSAPLKTTGSPTKEMTPEERAVLQALVDDSFKRFKEIVGVGRPKLRNDAEAMKKATTGQVFSAQQALDLGLVDKIGFLEDAIDRALELAHLDRGSTKVVKYQQPKSLADLLVGARAPRRNEAALEALLDMTTPRAYYLFAWPHLAE